MRIMMAGTGSGCGKTTVSLILMAALKRMGLDVAPYKVGPDYIDPGFHAVVCGRPAYNLDGFLMREESARRALSREADIRIVEGVMGYYDGLEPESLRASTWEMARKTNTPVILAADASGGAASVAATVKGFQTLKDDSGIAGVLLNRVSSQRHYDLARKAIEYYTGLPCVGYLSRQQTLQLQSRHLGLVPVQETQDFISRLSDCAAEAEKTLNLPLILSLAAKAPALDPTPAPALPDLSGCKLGVARDEAFHFYYQDNLDALERAGAALTFFSPLRDEALPEGLTGLYLGGGFPEVFAEGLSQNVTMRESVRLALEAGLPCYAECGGLMYLSQEIDGYPMVDFLPAKCRMTPRLQRFGYVNVLEAATGLSFPAHEFHHAVAEALPGASLAYTVKKASDPQKTWRCGFQRGHTLGAFAHVYFADRPDLIRRFFQ